MDKGWEAKRSEKTKISMKGDVFLVRDVNIPPYDPRLSTIVQQVMVNLKTGVWLNMEENKIV